MIWSKHEVVRCKPACQGIGDCYTHPQAGLGIAITMVSLALASLMVLVCVLANNLLFALRRG